MSYPTEKIPFHFPKPETMVIHVTIKHLGSYPFNESPDVSLKIVLKQISLADLEEETMVLCRQFFM